MTSTVSSRCFAMAFGTYPARPDQRAHVIIEDDDRNAIQFFGARLPKGRELAGQAAAFE